MSTITMVPGVLWPALAALVALAALWIIVRKSLLRRGRAVALARAPVLEVTAMVLLLLGGFLFLAGWFVGCTLLWISPRWRWTDKLLGTLVWPGGLLPGWMIGSGVLFLLGPHCFSGRQVGATLTIPAGCVGPGPVSGWPWPLIAAAIVLLLGPLAVAARLLRKIRTIPGHGVTEG